MARIETSSRALTVVRPVPRTVGATARSLAPFLTLLVAGGARGPRPERASRASALYGAGAQARRAAALLDRRF